LLFLVANKLSTVADKLSLLVLKGCILSRPPEAERIGENNGEREGER
jgi:hypothetical protein